MEDHIQTAANLARDAVTLVRLGALLWGYCRPPSDPLASARLSTGKREVWALVEALVQAALTAFGIGA